MIVIPMAGLSRRFTDAGYTKPKYRLDLLGRPVFDYAVGSFADRFGREPFLFALGADRDGQAFVRQRVHVLGVPEARTVCLGRHTAGQAETVALALEAAAVADDEPLTIFNIDTFRPGFEMRQAERQADGFLEVFRDSGDAWSFVEPVPDDLGADAGRAARVVEKQRISDLCSTGLYFFRRRRHFDDAYRAEIATPTQALKEHYIAPIYNHLIVRGLDVRYRVIDRNAVIFCGTPAEYEALRASPASLGRLQT